MVDAGDELVCPRCGVVREKVVVDVSQGSASPALGCVPLGSYLGTFSGTNKERRTKGITGTAGGYQYLKRISDTAGRDDGSAGDCARLIGRVGERLFLPGVVQAQAAAVARRVLASVPRQRRVTTGSVSAFSLITACRIEGVASVSASEIIEAHRALGKRVTSASVMGLAMDSPVRALARGPVEYIPMVLGRLSSVPGVVARLNREGVPLAPYLAELREASTDLLRLVGGSTTAGKRPCALAGASVYSAELALSSIQSRKKRLTQRDVSEVADAAEYTIREQCADLFAPAVAKLVARRLQTRSPPSPPRTALQVLAPPAG